MTDPEKAFLATLYRMDCPETTELGEYHLGLQESTRRAAIQQHLKSCPHCTRELAEMAHFLEQLQPELEVPLAERVRVLVARLVSGAGFAAGLAPSPAYAQRGATQPLRIYQAGAAQLTLETTALPGDPQRRVLLGLLVGLESGGMLAGLWRAGEKLTSTALDELGNFTLEAPAPGVYDLILSNPTLEIHVQELDIS
jgi:hypothetical protein